jgi:hypothetical protein
MQHLPTKIPTYIRERIPDAIVPAVFVEAMRALAACRTLDESKFWADKADALAAWAKIYKNDDAATEARRLKAHAYRRMCQLADDVASAVPAQPKGVGRPAAANTALTRAGLSKSQIKNVLRVGSIPADEFESLIKQPKPPSMTQLAQIGIGLRTPGMLVSSPAWRAMALYGRNFRTFCRANPAFELGKNIYSGEVTAAKALVKDIREWLDEYEASLPDIPQS